MSINRSILFAISASWFSRGLTIILGMLLLPVLFRNMQEEELGIWMLIAQTWPILGVLDFGFRDTLTRRVAFARGKSGSSPDAPFTHETQQNIATLMATSVQIYRVLAVVTVAISFALGVTYIASLGITTVPKYSIYAAWAAICISQGVTVSATPWTCLLLGVGFVGWESIVASLINTIVLGGQIIIGITGGGILGLAVFAALGAIAQRVIIMHLAKKKRPDLFLMCGKWSTDSFTSMIPFAIRAWLTGIGASLILFTDQFMITYSMGARELPVFRATWVLVHNISIVAITLGVASSVFISHLWQEGEIEKVHKLIDRNVRFGWICMLTGAGVLLFAGQPLFNLWLGKTHFLGYGLLVVFLATETLESQSYIISCASRATEDEAFALSTVVAGVLKLVLSIILMHYLGLFGVALGTLIALLLTNHLYVPIRGLHRLRYPRIKFLLTNVAASLVIFLVLSSLLYGATVITEGKSEIIQISLVLTIASCSFVCSIWFFVMEPSERKNLRFPRIPLKRIG